MIPTATRLSLIVLIAAFAFAPLAAQAQPCQCQQQDNGSGTVTMPPGCVDGYIGTMQIVTGLVNATLQIDVQLKNFLNVVEVPGGTLGGTTATFLNADLQMSMTGTGALNGFNRLITIPISGGGQMDFGPRVLNAPVQVFAGDPRNIQGSIFGDPDFDFIHFRTGTANGFPGSGSSTLTRIGGIGTDFIVDSFFDIEYEIEFQGALGSVLQGMGGIHPDFTQISICGTPPVGTEERSWGAVKALYR
jgi:hypothetical protein